MRFVGRKLCTPLSWLQGSGLRRVWVRKTGRLAREGGCGSFTVRLEYAVPKRAVRSVQREGVDVYAIFEDGGKQYKVTTGDKLLIELHDLPEGQTEITFDKVLLVGEGADAHIGAPWVAGAAVKARVLEQLKTPKVRGVKFRRRKGYCKRWGHRQKMLKVEIGAIEA